MYKVTDVNRDIVKYIAKRLSLSESTHSRGNIKRCLNSILNNLFEELIQSGNNITVNYRYKISVTSKPNYNINEKTDVYTPRVSQRVFYFKITDKENIKNITFYPDEKLLNLLKEYLNKDIYFTYFKNWEKNESNKVNKCF